MNKPILSSPGFKEQAVQRGEQPGLDLGYVTELVPLRCPDVEGLLGQILRVGLHPRQAHGEPEQRLVMRVHNSFKLSVRIHNQIASATVIKIKTVIPDTTNREKQWDEGADHEQGNGTKVQFPFGGNSGTKTPLATLMNESSGNGLLAMADDDHVDNDCGRRTYVLPRSRRTYPSRGWGFGTLRKMTEAGFCPASSLLRGACVATLCHMTGWEQGA